MRGRATATPCPAAAGGRRASVPPFDFEVAAPTPEALQPIYDSILNAVKRHYDHGLRLFLENGGRGLKIPISSERLLALARGDGAKGG